MKKNNIIFLITTIFITSCSQECIVNDSNKDYTFNLVCNEDGYHASIDEAVINLEGLVTNDIKMQSTYINNSHIVVSCVYEKTMNIFDELYCNIEKDGVFVANVTLPNN